MVLKGNPDPEEVDPGLFVGVTELFEDDLGFGDGTWGRVLDEVLVSFNFWCEVEVRLDAEVEVAVRIPESPLELPAHLEQRNEICADNFFQEIIIQIGRTDLLQN